MCMYMYRGMYMYMCVSTHIYTYLIMIICVDTCIHTYIIPQKAISYTCI